jgi:hypothetical protein
VFARVIRTLLPDAPAAGPHRRDLAPKVPPPVRITQ